MMAFNTSSKNDGYDRGGSGDAGSKSYIGKTMQIKGEISSDEFLTVEGKIEGNVNVSKTLTIGQSGYVDGEIKAEEVKIDGKAEGSIIAENRLEITSSGDFYGNIKSEKIVIEEGAVFKGKVNVDK